jgi:hypothetical protein
MDKNQSRYTTTPMRANTVNTSRSTPVTTLDTDPWIMFTSLVMRLISWPVGVRS